MQPDQRGSAGRAALLILAALAVAAVTFQKTVKTDDLHYLDSVDACSSLPGRAAQLCSSYHTAVGPEKSDVAVHWRQLSPATCMYTFTWFLHVLHTSAWCPGKHECFLLPCQAGSHFLTLLAHYHRQACQSGTIYAQTEPVHSLCTVLVCLQMLALASQWSAYSTTCAAAAAVVLP